MWRTLDKKSMPIVAWYVLSNESYMNRVINDVFPTASNVSSVVLEMKSPRLQEIVPLCSPKNTSLRVISTRPVSIIVPMQIQTYLNFFNGFEYDPTPDVAAIVGVSTRGESGAGVVQNKRGELARDSTPAQVLLDHAMI